MRDPQTDMQLCPLQYCINKNHNYKRVRGGIEVLYGRSVIICSVNIVYCSNKKSREKENARNRKKKEEKLEGGITVTKT